jgi:hypothetical protein
MPATIQVCRPPGGWTDRARKYGVHVDGEERGKLGHGETLDLAVEPGSHAVRLKVDWCSSRTLDLDLADGETARLEAAPRFALTAIFAAVLYFWDYIELREI